MNCYKHDDDIIDSKLGDREGGEFFIDLISDDEDEDDDLHPDVAIENQLERINNSVAVIMLDDDVYNVDGLKVAIMELEMVVAEDSRIRNGSYITRDVVRRLIHLLDSEFYPLEERWELQVNAVLILSNLENWDTVSKRDSLPVFQYLLHSEYTDIIEKVLKTLTKFVSSRSVFDGLYRFGTHLLVEGVLGIPGLYHPQLIRIKAEFALAVSIHLDPTNKWARQFLVEMEFFLDYKEDVEVVQLACSALFNLTRGAHIPLTSRPCILEEQLVQIVEKGNSVHVAHLALKVLGNVARWGHDYYNGCMIKGGLLECILRLLKGGDRIAQNEACWIISNVTASSKLEVSSIWDMIICLSSLLEKHDSEPELKMNAAWTIFNFFIGLVDYEQIRWPRRTGKATLAKKLSFSTFRPVDP